MQREKWRIFRDMKKWKRVVVSFALGQTVNHYRDRYDGLSWRCQGLKEVKTSRQSQQRHTGDKNYTVVTPALIIGQYYCS